LEVDAVEKVLFVAFVVEDGKLGSVEEATGVQSADCDEVAPVAPPYATLALILDEPNEP